MAEEENVILLRGNDRAPVQTIARQVLDPDSCLTSVRPLPNRVYGSKHTNSPVVAKKIHDLHSNQFTYRFDNLVQIFVVHRLPKMIKTNIVEHYLILVQRHIMALLCFHTMYAGKVIRGPCSGL